MCVQLAFSESILSVNPVAVGFYLFTTADAHRQIVMLPMHRCQRFQEGCNLEAIPKLWINKA